MEFYKVTKFTGLHLYTYNLRKIVLIQYGNFGLKKTSNATTVVSMW